MLYSKLTEEEINSEFIKACKGGDLDLVNFLLTSDELPIKADINFNEDEGFRGCCKNGFLEIAKFLLTDPKLKKSANIHAKLDQGLRNACENGHLNIVEYLLTSPKLQGKQANIHALNDSPLEKASFYGHIDIVKFLTSSKQLKEKSYQVNHKADAYIQANKQGHFEIVKFFLSHPTTAKAEKRLNIFALESDVIANVCESGNVELLSYLLESKDLEIHKEKLISDPSLKNHLKKQLNQGLVRACRRGHLNIVKYLTKNLEEEFYADIHCFKDSPVKEAFFGGNLNILEYLIFDVDIQKTNEIEEFLIGIETNKQSTPHPISFEKLENLFKARDFNKKLQKELPHQNNITPKKMKM